MTAVPVKHAFAAARRHQGRVGRETAARREARRDTAVTAESAWRSALAVRADGSRRSAASARRWTSTRASGSAMHSSTQARSRLDRNIHMLLLLPVTVSKPARAARRLIGQRAHRGPPARRSWSSSQASACTGCRLPHYPQSSALTATRARAAWTASSSNPATCPSTRPRPRCRPPGEAPRSLAPLAPGTSHAA
jgi:hypothetical protein